MGRISLAAIFLLCACDSVGPTMTGSSPPAPSEWKSETKLQAMLPKDAALVGVTVSPEGKRYVLDRKSGLYEVGTSTAKLVFATTDLATRFGVRSDLELTDVVALGLEQFAVTAENDGFLLDLHNGTFASYFCYLPAAPPATGDPGVGTPPSTNDGPMSISQRLAAQGIAVKQRTESVAFTSDGKFLFAQPRTVRMDTGETAGSEVFMFAESGGQPVQIRAIDDPNFVAGGMIAVNSQWLLLGQHNRIYALTSAGPMTLRRTFTAPIEITGMARDIDGDVIVLDGAGRRLLEIERP